MENAEASSLNPPSCLSFSFTSSEEDNEDASPREDVLHPLLVSSEIRDPPICVMEGQFLSPTTEQVDSRVFAFERKRLIFNAVQLKFPTTDSLSEFNRRRLLLSLASSCKRLVICLAERVAFSQPPTVSMSWLGVVTDAQEFELCFRSSGLSVWRKDFGNGRMMIRGDFMVPFSPAGGYNL